MPLAESMISSLKSNKSVMLDKSKRFRKTLGGYNKNRKGNFGFPEATPEILLKIRKKLKREQQILWLKISIVSIYNNNAFGLDAIGIIKKAIILKDEL